jgi:hypothetical protein
MCVNGKWSLVGSTAPPKIATVAGVNQPIEQRRRRRRRGRLADLVDGVADEQLRARPNAVFGSKLLDLLERNAIKGGQLVRHAGQCSADAIHRQRYDVECRGDVGEEHRRVVLGSQLDSERDCLSSGLRAVGGDQDLLHGGLVAFFSRLE